VPHRFASTSTPPRIGDGDQGRAHRGAEHAGQAALVVTSPPYGRSVHGQVRAVQRRGGGGVEKYDNRYSIDPANLAHHAWTTCSPGSPRSSPAARCRCAPAGPWCRPGLATPRRADRPARPGTGRRRERREQVSSEDLLRQREPMTVGGHRIIGTVNDKRRCRQFPEPFPPAIISVHDVMVRHARRDAGGAVEDAPYQLPDSCLIEWARPARRYPGQMDQVAGHRRPVGPGGFGNCGGPCPGLLRRRDGDPASACRR
jgi:hypothetical protein